jgi:hypothetical protein
MFEDPDKLDEAGNLMTVDVKRYQLYSIAASNSTVGRGFADVRTKTVDDAAGHSGFGGVIH